MFQIFNFNRWNPDETGNAEVQQALDEILAFASETENTRKLETAREKYFSAVGQAFEDDPDFIQRMNSFLEWFVFDYKPDNGDLRPTIEKYVEAVASEANAEIVGSIANHNHSVFLVKECRKGVIKVKDLVSRKTFYVTSHDTLENGDILESRIISHNSYSFFSYTHCLHPKTALKPIKVAIKRIGRDQIKTEFFLELGAMQYRWRRYRQIDLNQIYKFKN